MSSLQQWNSTYKTKFFEPWTEWKGDKSYKRHKCVFCGNSIQDNATYLKKHLTSCKAPQCSLEVKAQAEQSLNSGASKNKRSHDDLTHSSQHSASLADALPMPPASGSSSVGAESDVADECPAVPLSKRPFVAQPRQASIPFSAIPANAEQKGIERAIGFFLFASGRPFSLLDDPFFRNNANNMTCQCYRAYPIMIVAKLS